MDAVKSFNNELSSLYEVKPPISKAKMTSLTRGAIKAIKFYKHVVQSVEKFILKCKPEYKVPGLYVIDSIVRQSRHQFGPERDVFASRFSKNMQQTFINLFKCPAEDKSKVIRVLNLWQKNQVFPPEVIQPLFDLTDPNHPMYKEQMLGAQSNGLSIQNSSGNNKGSPALQRTPKGASQVAHQTDAHLSGVTNNPGSITDQNTLAQLQQLQKLLQKQGVDGGKGEGQPVRFDRKLLDFDYDDEEEDDHVNPSPKLPSNNNNSAIETVGSLLSNPEVLRQLQTLQQTMTQAQAQQHQEMDIDTLRKLQEMKQQEEEFDKHLAQTVPKLPFASECDFKAPIINNSPAVLSNYYNMTGVQDMTIPPPGYKQPYDMPSQQDEATVDSEIQFVGGNDSLDLEVINLDHVDSISQSPQDERYSNRRRRSRSGDRSRDRVRERDRRSRRSRTRSRSRDRRRRSRSRGRDREREREKQREREKEKERLKRGLPPVKKDNLSVCSTTLWVGHLSKLVHQEELSDTFGEFGDVVSIDLIPPRGCAFICMHRRQDALRCLEKLKSHKMQGKAITLAWAPGKGVKGKDLKDYWEVDLGVSYIPWTKLKPDIDMELLEEGGMIDEETMPSWLKTKQQQLITPQLIPPPQPPMIPPEIVQVVSSITAPTMTTSIDTSQPPPMPSGLLQPPPLTLPLVSSFQLGNRLLGAVGMNLPHGMMSNVPIGVPPPSMSGAMLSNQLLGMGSPFGHQGPPGLLPPPLPMQTPDKIPTTIPDNIGSRPESLLGLPFGMISQPQISMSLSHEDNMDVEMEDASDRMDKQPPLSDQLLAALGQQNNETSLSAAVSRLHAVTNQRSNSILDSSSDGGDRRGDRLDRSRDKDRDHRSMRRNSRERNKDRDKDRDSRDRRDDRRDRTNRWGDRDRDDHNDRKERNEKSLNDRLREMAHQGSYKDRRSVDNDFNSRDSLPAPFHPPYNDRDDSQDLRINHEDRFRHGPPHDDSRVRRRSDNWEEPEFEPPPPFINRNDNGPPRPHMNRDDRPPMRHHFNRSEGGPHRPPLLDHEDMFMEDNRYRRNEDFMDEPIHDSYELPMREGLPMRDGPAFGGPGMAGPGLGMGFRPGMGPRPPIMGPRPMMGPGPRMGPSGPRLGPRPDFWGPPRPMRLHGPPDGFHPRGRMPNPHKFLPRGGPPIRGLRPPGPPMRHNFQPRFDGPPDHFQGHSGPPGPPGIFDDIPPPRERRDNRRQFSQQDYNGDEEHNGRDRRSTRWGNSAPTDNENEAIETDQNEKTDNAPGDDIVANEDSGIVSQESENLAIEQGDGNSTPLHDEPRDHVVEKDEPQQVTETENETDSAEVIAE